MTYENVCNCSFNTQNCGVITAWCASVSCMAVLSTLSEVTNTKGFGKFWNFRYISVLSLLPISEYMWIISTWWTKYLVSHHCKWQTCSWREHNRTANCGGDALEFAFALLWCAGRSSSVVGSCWTGWEYSAGWLTSIGRNVPVSQYHIGESTNHLRCHSLSRCSETLFWLLVPSNTHERHATCHPQTLHVFDAPHEFYLFSSGFSFSCTFSVHSV